MHHLISIDDLDDEQLEHVLAIAHAFADGIRPGARPPALVALLFLTSSLRTRLGFGAAAVRLGHRVLDVSASRWDSDMSTAESFDDTLRTVSGMVDLAVVRAPVKLAELELSATVRCALINGGDLSQHPTQAVIDLFTIERLVGRIGDVSVAMMGDLTMRAPRSLLQMFARRSPSNLILIAPPSRNNHGLDLGDQLAARTYCGTPDDLSGVDVVFMTGLAPSQGARHLNDDARRRYALTKENLATMSSAAVVLSPMPVIDEIDREIRKDARVRIFDESDLSVYVRMAVLEHLLRDHADLHGRPSASHCI